LKSFGFSPADIKAVCQMAANQKAATLIENGNGAAEITQKDIIKSLKDKRKDIATLDWFGNAVKELKGKTGAELVPYKTLIKDVKFWYLQANGYRQMQNALSFII